jgi:hypothetical protein
MLSTELGLRNGEARHRRTFVSPLRPLTPDSWSLVLLVGVLASGGNAVALGAIDAGKELIEERLETVPALSCAFSPSVYS